jgi:hypothetical protein
MALADVATCAGARSAAAVVEMQVIVKAIKTAAQRPIGLQIANRKMQIDNLQ